VTSRGLEIRVGALVVLAAIILVVGTMWFQRFQLVDKRYHLFARFNDVGGLVAGDVIFINGVERGRVETIDLLPGHVVVDLGIREGVLVPVDSRVTLKSIGIMGERLVAVTLGSDARAFAPGDSLDGELLMGLSEVMGAAGGVVDDVEVMTKRLREVAEMLAADGALREGVDDFAATSKNLRGMTEGSKNRIDRTLARFERASTLFDSLMTTHYPAVDSSLAAIGRVGGRAEVAVDNLANVSGDLREITAKLRSGEGSAGRLLNDDTFILRLEKTAASLDSLILDMQRNPGRYVKFSLF